MHDSCGGMEGLYNSSGVSTCTSECGASCCTVFKIPFTLSHSVHSALVYNVTSGEPV